MSANPLLMALFRKMRGIDLPRDVRQMATPLMRKEAKSMAKGGFKDRDITRDISGKLSKKQSSALDRILEMGGTSRYDDPRIDDALDLLMEMYMRGGGRR